MLKLLPSIQPQNTRYDRVNAPASILYSQKMISFGSRLIACCKLTPTLVRQMWRHNYAIDRNEYLIFTLSESINPWVYHCNFCLNPQIIPGDIKECEWVFFSEHSVRDPKGNLRSVHTVY